MHPLQSPALIAFASSNKHSSGAAGTQQKVNWIDPRCWDWWNDFLFNGREH